MRPFAELWKHRGLLWQFTLRNVELRHKGSHLGLFWSLLSPLLMLGLYVFVFGFIFDGSFDRPGETRVEYALAIFFGLALFHFLAETIGAAPGLIIANQNLVKKVIFPLEILPAAAVGASLIHLFVTLGLILLGVAFFGNGLTTHALWLPVIILPVVLLGTGLAWFIAAVGVFFRDLQQLTQFLLLVLMFSSAIFYSSAKIPDAAWTVLRFNPLLLAVELGREAVLWAGSIDPARLAYLYGSAGLMLLVGYAAFRGLRPAFADVL